MGNTEPILSMQTWKDTSDELNSKLFKEKNMKLGVR